jgi:DNA polymerase I-like protein with 3'-5' exonuclease and polymerase domains|tara:strand:+ start:5953 stop:8067 length:2115 start_codon:yes stop_codon:yes gene_type:complete
MRLVLDVENSVTHQSFVNHEGEKKEWVDLTPYHPDNFLVSVGLGKNPTQAPEDTECLFFQHNTHQPTPDGAEILQNSLDETDLLICHNAKHDLAWLQECGFVYNKELYCTQIAEYLLCRAVKKSLKLDALAKEYDLPLKKSEMIEYYLANKIGFEDIPPDVVEEYGRGDVHTTACLFNKQQERFKMPTYAPLIGVLKMMCAFTPVLIELERNGVKIDREELDRIGKEYEKEAKDLDVELNKMIYSVMGDRPINLKSPDDKSMLLYSRKVTDKKTWKEVFNIGKDHLGNDKKRPYMSKSQFNKIVRSLTEVVYRQEAKHCDVCDGKKFIQRTKVNGDPFKNTSKCPGCEGKGMLYIDTHQKAGFKLAPASIQQTAAAGFTSNKDELEKLRGKASETAQVFLTKLERRNALTTYLSTYVGGIKRFTDGDGFLRASYNQTVAATGRLSCTQPNLMNFPRAKTFPVRKVFTTRFEGGNLLDSDQGQLEFRIAGFLSRCKDVRNDIDNHVDAHAFTRDTINAFDPSLPQINRQDAKVHTFKPLYGGMSGTPREVVYYEAFLDKYPGVKAWHEVLKKEVLNKGYLTIASGRQYAFPYARRLANGYVLGSTKIVNYPVQGFATADLVPLGVIAIWRRMKIVGVKSLLVLTVHDDIVSDIYPGEEEIMTQIHTEGLLDMQAMCQEFFGIDFDYPLEVESKIGKNWLEMETIE